MLYEQVGAEKINVAADYTGVAEVRHVASSNKRTNMLSQADIINWRNKRVVTCRASTAANLLTIGRKSKSYVFSIAQQTYLRRVA